MSKRVNHENSENWDDATGRTYETKFCGISDKQRALMIKLGIKFDNRTTRKKASELISKHLNKG